MAKKWSEMTEQEINRLKQQQCMKCEYYSRWAGDGVNHATCEYIIQEDAVLWNASEKEYLNLAGRKGGGNHEKCRRLSGSDCRRCHKSLWADANTHIQHLFRDQ